jgi:hypothetical protein
MKSNVNSVLWRTALHVIPRRRCIAVAAALSTLGAGSVFAQDYDELNVIPLDDYFDVPTPPIDEYVEIGGFEIRVDRTKWGIDLTQRTHGLLGRLKGHDVDIDVIERSGSESLDRIARDMASADGASVHIDRIFTRHAIPGLKAVYGERLSLLSQNIRAMHYCFVNSKGEAICFEAHAKTSHPDWSDSNALVLNTLSLAKGTLRGQRL